MAIDRARQVLEDLLAEGAQVEIPQQWEAQILVSIDKADKQLVAIQAHHAEGLDVIGKLRGFLLPFQGRGKDHGLGLTRLGVDAKPDVRGPVSDNIENLLEPCPHLGYRLAFDTDNKVVSICQKAHDEVSGLLFQALLLTSGDGDALHGGEALKQRVEEHVPQGRRNG